VAANRIHAYIRRTTWTVRRPYALIIRIARKHAKNRNIHFGLRTSRCGICSINIFPAAVNSYGARMTSADNRYVCTLVGHRTDATRNITLRNPCVLTRPKRKRQKRIRTIELCPRCRCFSLSLRRNIRIRTAASFSYLTRGHVNWYVRIYHRYAFPINARGVYTYVRTRCRVQFN